MNKSLSLIIGATLFCFLYVTPINALVGAGLQWGFDFTLDMEDNFYDPLTLNTFGPDIMIDSLPNLGNELPISIDELKQQIPGSNAANALPFTLSRSEWTRSVINFGGKVFIDDIKIIDAVEVSFNMGAWEYEAMLKYPNGGVQENISQEEVDEFIETGNYEKLLTMDSVALTLDEFNLSYLKMFGISRTPYFKLHIDATIRKNLFAVPKELKTFRMYLGGGISFHLGTPIITPSFIADVLDSPIKTAIEKGGTVGNFIEEVNHNDRKSIIQSLIEESKDPTFGMHILGGTMIKFPVIPVGIFADAKYMIPFGDMDKNVDIGGFGFLINAGICLSL